MRRDPCLRILALLVAMLPIMLLTSAAVADDIDAEIVEIEPYDEDEEEDEEPSAFQEYLSSMGNRCVGGLNGIITSPADTFALTAEGPEIFKKLPFASVTGRVAGFGAGILQGIYRLVMGVSDMALAPVPYMPMLGPVPRYKFLTFEHEDE